jgi:hypothetical protein
LPSKNLTASVYAAEYIDGQTPGEEIRANRRPSEDDSPHCARSGWHWWQPMPPDRTAI